MTKETKVLKPAAGGPDVPAASQSQWKEVVYKAFGCEDTVTLSIEMVRKYIATPSKSGKFPEDRDCITFLMMCKAKQLNPWEGDAFLVGYDCKDGTTKWTQITAHQAMMKRAELNEDYDGMESGVIVRTKAGEVVYNVGDFRLDDETLLGSWCKIHLKSVKYPVEKRLRVQTFCRDTAIWGSNREGMIVKCAEADALRTAFPSTIGGLHIREEIDLTPEKPDNRPKALPPAAPPPPTNDAPPPPETPAEEPPKDAPEPEDPKTAMLSEIEELMKLASPSKVTKVLQAVKVDEDSIAVPWNQKAKWRSGTIEELTAIRSMLKA